MAKAIDKTLAEMRGNPTGIRFVDAMKVCEHYFGQPRRSGGSHYVFKTPWPGNPRINLQEGESGKAKAYQIRQVVEAIDKKELMDMRREGRGEDNG